MDQGTSYLLASVWRAAQAVNARTPWGDPATIPGTLAFFAGLGPSELPLWFAAGDGLSLLNGLRKDVQSTTRGKVGLALTGAAAASLVHLHRRSADSEDRVEIALRAALGDGYRDEMVASPMRPRTTALPVLPTKIARRRYVREEHISYGPAGRRNKLDIWRRPDLPDDARSPVLLQIHGGAWISMDKEGQGYPLMTHLAERGWVCVSANYRLSPKATWPEHIIDVKQAIAWVKEHIGDHGGDPDWVAITGGSAGGHLSSLAAVTPNEPQFQPGFEDADTSVRAGVPFYGIYDWSGVHHPRSEAFDRLLREDIVKHAHEDGPEVYESASPISHIGPESVPMFLLHGTNDTLVDVAQARLMVDAIRAVSTNPVVYAEFPGAQHAFDVFSTRRTDHAVSGIERFLNVCRARSEAHRPSTNGHRSQSPTVSSTTASG